MVDNMVSNGYELIISGKHPLDRKDYYHLVENRLDELVPASYHQEGNTYVLVYNLGVGYSIGEIFKRKEDTITLQQIILLLEKVLYLKQQYFFDENKIYLSLETILYTFETESLRLLYSPYFQGSFMESIFQLVGIFFKEKEWFSTYLQKVNQYMPFVTLENYFGLMNLLEDSLVEEGELEEGNRPFSGEPIDEYEVATENLFTKYFSYTFIFNFLKEKNLLWLMIPILFSFGFLTGLIFS